MFEFKFAILWLGIIGFITFVVWVNGGIFSILSMLFFLIPFWAIGIYILKIGIDKINIDKQTDTLGENCYGVITNIYPTGSYVNSIPELKADVTVYIPSQQEVIDVSEVLGMADKVGFYKIGTYVQLRYFEGDINFECILDESLLPITAKEQLSASDSLVNIKNTNDIDNNTIVINGVEYVRNDRLNNINKY